VGRVSTILPRPALTGVLIGPVMPDSTVRSIVSRLPSYERGTLRQGKER
jgi:hypothetical protein